VRQYKASEPRLEALNFKLKPYISNHLGIENQNLYDLYNKELNKDLKESTFFFQTLNSLFCEAPFSPIFSNNNLIDSLNYDHSNKLFFRPFFSNRSLFYLKGEKKSTDIFTLRGKRDGAPNFLNTNY
jgi:hypothetical protein